MTVTQHARSLRGSQRDWTAVGNDESGCGGAVRAAARWQIAS